MKLERQFSQELAPNLRQETADKLRAARNQPDSYNDLKEISPDGLPVEYESWFGAQENFSALKKDVIGKIFKTEKYKEKVSKMEDILKWKKESDTDSIKREYEKKFAEIMDNCPLSKEERDKYLSTEAMEEMSLDNYLTLLKRLSGEAFYHVTRYGVRENTFMSTGGGHTAGEGDFVNNLIPLLEDRRINSATSTIIKNNKLAINKDVVQELIKEGKSVTEITDSVMESYGTMYFLDRESSHFSYGKDLHQMYGGENNYKFCFYYPVEYILQNDFYQKTREGQITIGDGYYHNSGGINQTYNDFEIFNFGQGVPTEAGILCISDNIEVDPKTGSQYLLKDGHPEIGEDGKFTKPAETISSQKYWEEYFKKNPEIKPSKIIYGDFSTGASKENEELKNWADEKHIYKQGQEKTKEFEDYRAKTRQEIEKIVKENIKNIESSLN